MSKEVILAERIVCNQDAMLKKPVIRGARIPVSIIVEMVQSGETPEGLAEAYPELVIEDVYAALEYDAETGSSPKSKAQ